MLHPLAAPTPAASLTQPQLRRPGDAGPVPAGTFDGTPDGPPLLVGVHVDLDVGTGTVCLIGELDVATAGGLEDLLEDLLERQIPAGQVDVRLDVAGSTFCDVPGLQALS